MDRGCTVYDEGHVTSHLSLLSFSDQSTSLHPLAPRPHFLVVKATGGERTDGRSAHVQNNGSSPLNTSGLFVINESKVRLNLLSTDSGVVQSLILGAGGAEQL